MPDEIYFAQIREDSLVERTLQSERAPSHIVCIASGGCTALSLLRDDVARIYCVDANPAQCSLVELKIEAIRGLDRSAYLAFIGESPAEDRIATYMRLAPRLPAYARDYWDKRHADLMLGINQCGATERFYRFVGTNLRQEPWADEVWRGLFNCESLDAQRDFHKKHFTSDAWRAVVRVMFSRTTHLQFFPPFMFARATEGDLGGYFARQFEQEALSKPVSDNYFLSQLLFASYLLDRVEGMPRYLTEEGYAAARRNLHKLAVVPALLQEFLPHLTGVQAFFLSNVFDWTDHEDTERICNGVLQAQDRRALLLYRHMLSAHPLPAAFRKCLEIDESRCARLRVMERSMMYQQIVAGVLG